MSTIAYPRLGVMLNEPPMGGEFITIDMEATETDSASDRLKYEDDNSNE